MWPKDNYQEQMLGYLNDLQSEIEQLAQARLRQQDLNTLYIDLDKVDKRLWRLIGASNEEWEAFRYALEASCDELLRAFYRVHRAEVLKISDRFTVTEHPERSTEWWESVEMAW